MTFDEGMKTLLAFSAAGFVWVVLNTIARIIVNYDDDIEELYMRRLNIAKKKITETENHELKKLFQIYINMSGNALSDNKLGKTILEAATLTGLAACIGWIARKVAKETFTADPSYNAMNYGKFTLVMAGSIGLKNYLEDQKILPEYV